ncbi:MAG: hypothetical protein HY756_06970 [Nitrospirae bacterium]|nr:hypothetical protein [Nitrospirota bacterium]
MTEDRQETSTENIRRQLKKELLEVFHRFGYLREGKDYEIKIRTTSGSIAWININSMETIK